MASEESRLRMSTAQKKRFAEGKGLTMLMPEARAKARVSLTGRSLSSELKAKISEKITQWWSEHPEARIKRAIANQLRGQSPETRAKMSIQRKGRPIPNHVREAACAANRGKTRVFTLEWRRNISLSAPKTHSKEHNENKRIALKCHAQKDLPNCHCVIHTNVSSPTSIEVILEKLLADFPSVETQQRFSPYKVDAYLPPPYHLAFEADGSYWHRDKEKDASRDSYLLTRFGLPVVRLSEEDLLRMKI